MPWRWRRTGPTPIGSTATSWDSPTIRTRTRLFRTSADFRPGCGGTAMCWPLSNGFAPQRRSGHSQAQGAFYGLDLYSLERRWSRGEVPRPGRSRRAARARARYSCFDHVGARDRPTATPWLTRSHSLRERSRQQLIELRRRAEGYLRRDGWVADDEFFFAEQNARVVRDAEEYYQQMYRATRPRGTFATVTWPQRSIP